MSTGWESLLYADWSPTCDTLHAHTQLLGKLAVRLAPPEPQLQHAALRLTARGWETAPLRAPDGSGVVGICLDLRSHDAVVEHSDGRARRFALAGGHSVGEVARAVLDTVNEFAGPVEIDPTPQEVSWTVPILDDDDHVHYDVQQVERYFALATRAALVLAEFRAPFRGRCAPVNAWWGSFDLAVNFFSGRPAPPPSADFIMRNAMDAQEVAVGWWPGDARYDRAAFYAYAYPAPEGLENAELEPAAARWEPALGEFILDQRDVAAAGDPRSAALAFMRSVFAQACQACDWDPALAASASATAAHQLICASPWTSRTRVVARARRDAAGGPSPPPRCGCGPSLARIRETCTLAVFSAMYRVVPIWRFVAPWASSASTCRSLSVRPNGSAVVCTGRVGGSAAVQLQAGAIAQRPHLALQPLGPEAAHDRQGPAGSRSA